MRKIEKIKTTLVMSKIRKIMLKELKKRYYDNPDNVECIIDISKEFVINNEKSFYRIENIVYYKNEWIGFNKIFKK